MSSSASASSKKRRVTVVIDSDDDENENEDGRQREPPPKQPRKQSATSKSVNISDDEDSDDVPRRPASKTSVNRGKGRATVDAKAGDTPVDPEVKTLQSLVVACGVRKQWKNEYSKKGLATTASKLEYLKAMLIDLGLPEDNMTLESAKEIGEQRRLAKEAAELQGDDTAKGGRGSSRASKTQANKRTRQELNTAIEGDEEESDSGSSAQEDERKTIKKVDRRAGKNTDMFLAMLGLGPEPKKGKGKAKKKRKKSNEQEDSD